MHPGQSEGLSGENEIVLKENEGVAAILVFNWLFICLFWIIFGNTNWLLYKSTLSMWACVTLDNTPVAFVLHSRTICVCVHKLWMWCVPTLPHLRYFGAFRTNKQDFYFCWLWSTSLAKCIVCGTGSQVGRENTHALLELYKIGEIIGITLQL